MRWELDTLPGADLAILSFTARGEAPYLSAREELRAETVTAFDAAYPGGRPKTPIEFAGLTVALFVGPVRRRDHRFRPSRVTQIPYVLNGIYDALIELGLIAAESALVMNQQVLVRNAHREGWTIQLTDVAPALPELTPAESADDATT